MDESIHAFLFTRYPNTIASSRERFSRLRPYLATLGVASHTCQFFGNEYPPTRSLSSGITIAKNYIRRIRHMREAIKDSRRSCAVVQYEFLPFLPTWIEHAVLGDRLPIVIDYDDAWHHHYHDHPLKIVRGMCDTKIEKLMAKASAVAAGSRYLRDFANKYCANVQLVPTGVDLNDYPKSYSEQTGFVVGWIGSPATAKHLEPVRGALAEYLEKVGGRLIIMGATNRSSFDGVTEYKPWSPESAAEFFRKIHVGIMPLPDTSFERGKCAYKLIQYMAAWRPVVASPVGENLAIVEASKGGFLATSNAEWITRVDALRQSSMLRRTMGLSARRYIEDHYTHSQCAKTLAFLIHDACLTTNR